MTTALPLRGQDRLRSKELKGFASSATAARNRMLFSIPPKNAEPLTSFSLRQEMASIGLMLT